jgi:predicted RNase H-like nuclease (RuvC/YqgF family)
MAPSPADFSEITGLLEIKRLYEEAEERHRAKINEKDELIGQLEAEVKELRSAVDGTSDETEELKRQLELSRAETQRLRDESQQKINALNERIRDLNQRIQEGGKGAGFFKR